LVSRTEVQNRCTISLYDFFIWFSTSGFDYFVQRKMNMKQKIMGKNGVSLAYAEYGDQNGYPVLIQHGLIASIDDYGLFDRLIQLKTRLICIARPGYGESIPYNMNSFAEWADMVSSLIRELELTQFDVLAMSSGAPYGYSIGCGYPDKVRNIYIFSGMPALYDEIVRSEWPYDLTHNQDMDALKKLARELFFSHLTEADLLKNDVRDSLMHDGFGVAQDFKLRVLDWGFKLSDLKGKVLMRHSKCDDSVPFKTAVRTAELIPNCELELTETGPHFSEEALDDFIIETMGRYL
jgi:pimeloyl-ACP methyl ester carboxylesterase